MTSPVSIPGGGSGANPFLDPILERLHARPDGLFGAFHIAGGWREVTNAGFLERALAFAGAIREGGVGEGDLVFLILDHGLDAPAAFVGAMMASAMPSFLPYPNPRQNHADYWAQHLGIFTAARPRAILCFAGLAEELAARVAVLGIPVLDAARIGPGSNASIPDLPPGEAIALLQHSSGTTGLKKGVALSYAAITRQLSSYRAALALDGVARPAIASWLPLYHDMGLIAAFLQPLWAGIPIISIDPFEWVESPGLQLDAIERFGCTHLWLPNFAFIHIARRVPRGRTWRLDTLQAIISCSEPCKPDAFDLFLRRFGASGVRADMLQTCYAMAETVFAVSQSVPGTPPRRLTIDREALETRNETRVVAPDAERSVTLLSNGPCLSGCTVRAMRDGAVLDERQVGELVVDAEYLFSGYFNNPAETGKSLRDGTYHTGDLGFLYEGEVYVVGRIKDVLIVNGKNIYAHDVERSANSVAGVKAGRAVAFGRYSERYGSEQLVVVAESEQDGSDHDGIARAINHAVLAEIGIPCSDVRIVPTGWLVKTTSGKISRAANLAKYLAAASP